MERIESPRPLSSAPPSTLPAVVHYTQFAYPLALLVVFFAAFIAHGIATAQTGPAVSSRSNLTGPGGKPLPPTSRLSSPGSEKDEGFGNTKNILFCWLSIGLIATFIGNTVNIVVHAVTERESGWWCGQAAVVS